MMKQRNTKTMQTDAFICKSRIFAIIKIKKANGFKEKTIMNNQIRYHLYTTVAVRIVDDRH